MYFFFVGKECDDVVELVVVSDDVELVVGLESSVDSDDGTDDGLVVDSTDDGLFVGTDNGLVVDSTDDGLVVGTDDGLEGCFDLEVRFGIFLLLHSLISSFHLYDFDLMS